ncbi:hypothetical protein ACCO45_012392 [Purpureocillium lilacinum]|uniref:Uncharacterized protein n=1 Tax=Purpureocillium lilacinum TaxID=33203 RepID=A0ACC4D9G0_PURLI
MRSTRIPIAYRWSYARPLVDKSRNSKAARGVGRSLTPEAKREQLRHSATSYARACPPLELRSNGGVAMSRGARRWLAQELPEGFAEIRIILRVQWTWVVLASPITPTEHCDAQKPVRKAEYVRASNQADGRQTTERPEYVGTDGGKAAGGSGVPA